ncbi:PAS domain S-box protein, partial [Siccirubricoccus sp. KC 17139]
MVLDVGTRWCERTGLTYEETLGRGFATALHPDERAEVLGQWQHAVQTGEPCSLECRYIQADGRDRWVHVRATARRDDEGRVIRWYGTLEDIHDRKLAEIALRESELRFRVMSDDAPVAIWMCDADGLGTFVSRGWLEMTGLAEAESLGHGWLQAVHPKDRERAGQEFMAAHALCQPYRTEFRLRRADGSWGWVIDQGRPRFGVDGSFLGYVGSVTDITERRAMEAALRESEAFARSVLESSPNCIRVLDLEGSLQFMNRAGYRILEAEQGGNWAENLPVDYADEARQALAMAKAGIPSQHEAHRIMRSGAVQWLEIGIVPIPDADGRPARILSIAHDVTDIRQAREATEQAKQEAEAAAARLSSVLESTMDSVIVVDRDWRLTYLNGNASRALAARRPEIGINLWDMFPEEVEGIFARQYRRALAQQLPVAFEEFLPALNAWFEVQAYPTPEGLSIFFRDITERRRAEQDRLLAQEKITHMARHDVLTGLPNRVLFRERLERAVAESYVSKAVLYLDLDGFKAVNDTLGHPAGDALLRLVSERLQGVVRGSDLVARLGGDEFAIVQASCA